MLSPYTPVCVWITMYSPSCCGCGKGTMFRIGNRFRTGCSSWRQRRTSSRSGWSCRICGFTSKRSSSAATLPNNFRLCVEPLYRIQLLYSLTQGSPMILSLRCNSNLYMRYTCIMYTGWPKKSKPPPIFQKIVLRIANEIRFLCKVKVWSKHYNTIRW